jgi:hypothetical protein
MKLKREKRNMNRIKVVIETAKLNSVDHDDENENIQVGGEQNDISGPSIKKHYILCQVPSLSTDLGSLSYNLDKLAAQVDGIATHGDSEVKTMKKELSSKIVELMSLCDEYLKECGIE